MTVLWHHNSGESIGPHIFPRAFALNLHRAILAYNLGNFLHRLGLPKAVKDWSLRSLQVKLIKMGGRIVRRARKIIFQLAEVMVPRDLFAATLGRITRLCLAPG